MKHLMLSGTLRTTLGLALIGLGGCSTDLAHKARTQLLGMNEVDLLSCAGRPGHSTRLDAHQIVLDYDYTSNTSVASLDLLTFGSFSLGPRGECKAIFKLTDGVVTHVGYVNTTSSLEGPLGACGPIVEECMKFPPHTELPVGFKADGMTGKDSGY